MGRIRELVEKWRLLDTQGLLDGKPVGETTTTANVGAYPVPIGGVLRRKGPSIPEDPHYEIDPSDFRVIGPKKKKGKRKRRARLPWSSQGPK